MKWYVVGKVLKWKLNELKIEFQQQISPGPNEFGDAISDAHAIQDAQHTLLIILHT